MIAKTVKNPFNIALETGVRSLAILASSFPQALDLSRLVRYDYLVVHSADADGPPSLHPPLPYRSGELLVRRSLIEAGINLMISRKLVRHIFTPEGIQYRAEEDAGAFLDNLQAGYLTALRDRATWVSESFDHLNDIELEKLTNSIFSEWTTEFESHGPIERRP